MTTTPAPQIDPRAPRFDARPAHTNPATPTRTYPDIATAIEAIRDAHPENGPFAVIVRAIFMDREPLDVATYASDIDTEALRADAL